MRRTDYSGHNPGMTLLSRGWWARGRGGYATLAVIAAAAIAFFVCQWLLLPPASASNPEAPLAAAPGISYSQAISDTSVETNASITLRFRLRRLTGDAGHGGITVSFPDLDRANSSGSSSSYDSVDGSVSTKRYTNGASKVSYFPSGYSPIHNEDGSTGTAGHLIVESDDTDWPARDYRILELNFTPKQSGSYRIYYRFWLCGDQYDDCTRRPHSSQSDQVDQQGWHVGVYTVDVTNQASGPFARNSAEDFDTLDAADNESPKGIWSDETTMWVADWSDEKIYAYSMSNKGRVSSKDFDTLDDAGNDNPEGIWSDGTTMWVVDSSDAKIYAYNMSNKARVSSKDFDTLDAAGNDSPEGIWSDGTTMWVADWSDEKIYAYNMSNKARVSSKDFDTLDAASNGSPTGIWSDGTTMWVADSSDDKIYAYDMSNKGRVSSKDFDTLDAASNGSPTGIWSDRETVWVADSSDDKIYAYNAPEMAPAPTQNQNRSPSVSRVSPSSALVSLYTGDRQTFEASATDPDDNLKSYEWFVKDRSEESSPIWFGVLPTGSATDDFSHTFGTAGPYTVKATFTDKGGLSDSVSWTIVVIDPSRPSVDRVSPTQESLSLETGDSQSFTVRATDADNDLTKWKWEADWAGVALPHLDPGHTEPEASFALTGDTSKTFSYTFDTTGTWTVTATFTDFRGESGSVSWEVKVNVDPTVTRDSPPSPVSLYTGDRQTFTASATDPDNNLKSYEWFVGDRSQESSPIWFGALPTGSASDDFSHTFSSAGRYTVTATFTDAEGGSDSVSWTIVVIDPSRPSVDRVSPTQESLSLETGDSQSFTVRATDADNDLTKWKWEADWAGVALPHLDPGHTEPEASFALTGDTSKTFSYTFDTTGTWTVTATFTDSRGESGSVSWEVKVNVDPTVTRDSPPSPVSLYTGDRQTFTASATDPDNNLKSYEWFVGDRSQESSPIWFGALPTGSASDDFSHTFSSAGRYTVTATFTDAEGGSDSVSWTIVVIDPSRPSVDRVSPTQESLSLETGDSQSFTVRATDADNDLTKWKWEADWAGVALPHLDPGHTEPEASFALTGDIPKTFSYTFDTAGTWTVTATFTDSRGESGSVSWEVAVTDPNQAPSVTIDSPLEDPVSLTTGDSQTFRVRAIDPDDNISGWEWFVGDVSKGGQPLSLTGDISRQFSHTFSSAGSYTVKVTFTDSDGLSDSVSWEVQAGPNRGPDLAITITEQITPVVGKSMSIPVLLTNMGGSSSGPFNINVFFRNLDEETDAGTSITAEMSQAVIADRETGMIGNLDPYARGSLDGEQQGFTVPRSLDPGEYSLCVQIEYINPVAESDEDESNNTYCTPAYVLPDMGDDFPEEIQTFHFQDYYIYRHLIGHPAEFEYGDYWVFVPTKYTSPQEIADGINGRTFGAAKDRSNRIKLYRGLILEIARQKETHGDIFFDFVEVKDRVVGAGELADLSHEIAQAYTALEGGEVLLAHLEHLDGLSEIFKNGLVFGSLSLDVIISEAVNRSIEIEEAQKTLDILAKLPMDDAWAAAIRLAGEDLNQMTSPEAMERWGQAVEENLDEIVKAISEIIITKAATKTVLVVAGKIIGVKIVLLTAPISLTVGLAITAIYITIDQTGDFWEEISLATASAQVYASLYANDEKDKDKLLAYTKFAFYQHLYQAAYNRLLNNNLIFNLGENKPNQHKDPISKRRDFALAAIVDAPWNPAEDFNGPAHLQSVGSLSDGISSLSGIWSDGATMWVGAMWRVGNGFVFRIHTYDMATKTQVTGKVRDIAIPNISVTGIWSDGTTMWVADEFADAIHAYRMSDMSYDDDNDFDTLRAAENRDPKGIWSDGMTMWVADGDDDKIYAYKMSDMYHDVDKDFDTLKDAGNHDPQGIWSDGITMWVADGDDDKIYAYSMKNSKEREEAKEFNIAAVSDIGINEFPEGIWSDGTTMWVADGSELKIFAYATAPPTTPASPCSAGNAVADAANNPGLVADCEVLRAARDTLAGTASLNWSPDTPITAWDGVTVGGTPQRVTGLALVQEQLSGSIPPELGSLPNLQSLLLSGNQLTGCIPQGLRDMASNDLASLGLPFCDVLLSGLTISPGVLTPAFTSYEIAYTAAVGPSPITVTPANAHNAAIAFLGENDVLIPDADGALAGHQVDLGYGTTIINIKVTSQDGKASLAYAIKVTRSGSPDAPAIASPIAAGPASLTVSWTPPAGGTAITSYDLRYIESDAADKADANWTVEEGVWTVGTLSYTVTGLTGGAQYDVQVRAVTGAGEGPWSVTATEVPTAGATRSFSTSAVAPGGQLVVTITATGYGAFGGVAETLPSGFSYVFSSLSDDAVTAQDQELSFALFGETEFTYTVTAPDAAGSYPFSGILTNSDKEDVPVGGALSVTVGEAADVTSRYDANGNGLIEKSEVIQAINDYLFGGGGITKAEVIRLINVYLFS